MVWLTGGAFAIACLMIAGLLGFVLYQGLATLWPRSYLMLGTLDGELIAGEFRQRMPLVLSRQNLKDLGPKGSAAAEAMLADAAQVRSTQLYLRTGNFELTNKHFQFVADVSLASERPFYPPDVCLLERRQWGNLYGFPKRLSWEQGNQETALDEVRRAMVEARTTAKTMDSAKRELEHLDQKLASARLSLREVELSERSDLQRVTEDVMATIASLAEPPTSMASTLAPLLEAQSPTAQRALTRFAEMTMSVQHDQIEINERLAKLESEHQSKTITMQVPVLDAVGTLDVPFADLETSKSSIPESLHALLGLTGTAAEYATRPFVIGPHQLLLGLEKSEAFPIYLWLFWDDASQSASVHTFREQAVPISEIVRLVEPNRLSLVGKLGLYADRWVEFLFGQPREAGVEGGVFPAIWGTIVMTLIMSMVVMPFGVLAALYMREYAKGGWLLSAVRISINNLAGVPSIVYGVFGLSFFCYTVGGYIDGGPVKSGFEPWPSATWFTALGMVAIIGLAAFGIAFLSGRSNKKNAVRSRWIRTLAGLLWMASLVGIVLLLVKTPFFHGFYEARLPNPTFGKGCLLWAACTLALLTLPVVIVATEEALAAVPNSLREGSYACGAGKWQTIERIVLPYARPGIITGFILAMARGAGEVAPMMLVGAIPLAADLPLDLEFPFLHGSRSFMHLGFQIYALGFQSQNSEAAKPMVFTATLLLLTIVTLLNLTAIWLRARLRKRFQSSQF